MWRFPTIPKHYIRKEMPAITNWYNVTTCFTLPDCIAKLAKYTGRSVAILKCIGKYMLHYETRSFICSHSEFEIGIPTFGISRSRSEQMARNSGRLYRLDEVCLIAIETWLRVGID
jgi:hypothetical protein